MTSEAADLLLGLLAGEGRAFDLTRLSSATPMVWRQVLEMAARHRVRPQLLRGLEARPLPHLAAIQAGLEREVVAIGARNLRLRAETAAVIARLARAGIPVVVLKGPHLVHAVYGNWAAREIGDLDALVRPADLARALALLRGDGFRDAYPLPFDPAQHHHPAPLVRDGIKVELHWTIVPPAVAPAFDPAELWARAEEVDIAGRARVLAREDLLMHLCMHAAYTHRFACGLRPFCDIADLVRRFGPVLDWAAITERATRWAVERGVMLTLILAGQLVSAPIPIERLSSLTPFRPSPARARDALDSVFHDTGTGPERENPAVMRFAAGDVGVPARIAFATRRWLAPDGRRLGPVAAVRRTAVLAWRHCGAVLRLLTDGAWRQRAARQDRIVRWLQAGPGRTERTTARRGRAAAASWRPPSTAP